ncbi:MAG: DUF4426 domain-containing protein [Pseudomonadota bacterium]
MPAIALMLSLCSVGHAQQFEDFGAFEVHYSTINTQQLSESIARNFDIERRDNRAMLNVSVIDTYTDEVVKADITVTARNLLGQPRELQFDELQRDGVYYYIGQFRIYNEEVLRFFLTVKPEDHAGRPFEFQFSQQFYSP